MLDTETQSALEHARNEAFEAVSLAAHGYYASCTVVRRFSWTHGALTVGASLTATGSPMILLADGGVLTYVASGIAALAAWAITLLKGPEKVQREEPIRLAFLAVMRHGDVLLKRIYRSAWDEAIDLNAIHEELQELRAKLHDAEALPGIELWPIILTRSQERIVADRDKWLRGHGHTNGTTTESPIG